MALHETDRVSIGNSWLAAAPPTSEIAGWAAGIGRLAVALVIILAAAGCATHVTVSAEPEGAEIFARGSGRPSYSWRRYGPAPVTFKVYYNAIQTAARWPDETVSGPKRTSVVFQSNVHVHHDKSVAGDARDKDGDE